MMAIDIAPTFIRRAKEEEGREPLGIEFRVADGMAMPFAENSFDFATAFMSLMDMPVPGTTLREVSRVLRPGGFLQFSILHPCFAPPHRKVVRSKDGKAQAIEIGEYFRSTEGRVDHWWFTSLSPAERSATAPFHTPIFHRTLTEWFGAVCGAGLVIERIGEPTVESSSLHTEAVLADTKVAPLSLHIRARKPAGLAS